MESQRNNIGFDQMQNQDRLCISVELKEEQSCWGEVLQGEEICEEGESCARGKPNYYNDTALAVAHQ